MKTFTSGFETLDKFYPTYKIWCKKKGFPIILEDTIDEVYVCYWFRIPVYSCFIWNTNSKMVLIGFPQANPYIPYSLRKGGLRFLFEKMSDFLKFKGYTKIWTTSGTQKVMEALEKEGFVNADPGVNVYIKTI